MSMIMITFALAYLIAFSLHTYGVASCAFSYLKAPCHPIGWGRDWVATPRL